MNNETSVVIVGAGPTGMMLAAELTLAGTDVVVVERRRDAALESPRSRGLHARTIEVLDQRGIADRFISAGTPMQVQAFAGIPLDISDFPSRHNYGLALLQSKFEVILAEWIEELGVRVLRERDLVGFTQDQRGVDVVLSDESTIRADYLVGCDGAHSMVRKALGIEFAGWDATTCWITTEVEMTSQPPFGMRGGGGVGPAEGGRVGVTLIEPEIAPTEKLPTIDDVRAALRRVDGTDYGAHSPRYVSRFTDVTRQAVSYRDRRVLLAGDAAHIHAPLGGQGLNLGVQDAVNLGWKLAQVCKRISSARLLDTYQTERHPVAARVLQNTMAQRALGALDDDRMRALRNVLVGVMTMDEPRRSVAGTISGLDISYDLGAGHPLLGKRMPDLDVTTADGPMRVYNFLRNAKPVLFRFDPATTCDNVGWEDCVEFVDASFRGRWELPVIGEVSPPSAVLVRPDGHVAWVGTTRETSDTNALVDAMTTWFGSPNDVKLRTSKKLT